MPDVRREGCSAGHIQREDEHPLVRRLDELPIERSAPSHRPRQIPGLDADQSMGQAAAGREVGGVKVRTRTDTATS